MASARVPGETFFGGNACTMPPAEVEDINEESDDDVYASVESSKVRKGSGMSALSGSSSGFTVSFGPPALAYALYADRLGANLRD